MPLKTDIQADDFPLMLTQWFWCVK